MTPWDENVLVFHTVVGTGAKFAHTPEKSPVCCGRKERALFLNKLNSGQNKKERNSNCEQSG